jgi:hypothetical protein
MAPLGPIFYFSAILAAWTFSSSRAAATRSCVFTLSFTPATSKGDTLDSGRETILGRHTSFYAVQSGELRIEQNVVTAHDGNRARYVIDVKIGWQLPFAHSGYGTRLAA